MATLLDYLASALRADPILAGITSFWLAIILWGAAFVILAYCARLHERSAMVDPPRHPLFPNRIHKR